VGTERAGVLEKAELEIQREVFDAFFEASPLGMGLVDEDMRYVRVNEPLASMNGVPVAEHIGRRVIEIVPRFADRVEGLLRRVLETGKPLLLQPFSAPGRRIPPEHVVFSYFPVRLDASGRRGVGVVVDDVTPRKRIEEALGIVVEGTSGATGADFFRALVKNISAALGFRYALVAETQRPECKRARTLAVWGGSDFSEDFEYELAGTPCEEVMTKELCFYSGDLQERFPDDRQLVEMDAHSYMGMPLLDSNGAVLGVLAALHDEARPPAPEAEWLMRIFATRAGAELERTRAEAERRVLEDQLRQSQKMDAVGRLAGGIAHDFNNLLTAIIGNTELLREDVARDVRDREALLEGLGEIEHEAQRAAGLIRQLLAFSRRQVLKPEVLDPNRVLEDLEGMLRRLIGENIHLEVLPRPGLPRILADAGQMHQVLMNLVVNARDAMPDGGVLKVETDLRATARTGSVGTGAEVLIRVSDTGVGMDEDTLQRIFEPFFTTKALGKGTGLGLSMVHGIVEQSGGRVDVRSHVGSGTCFEIALPAHHGVQEREAQAEEAPLPRVFATETILVCEDDDSVRRMTRRILSQAGYRVLSARDASEAMSLATLHEGDIHLLVTDVIIPDSNGRRVADSIRKRRPDIAVLYVSGYSSDVIAHHGILDQDVEFLEKPFERATLLARVRQLLRDSVAAG
jgi:PAS domain S-box-containing protein